MFTKKYFTILILSLLSLNGISQSPNVVVIFADQWRGSALGYLGKEKVQTPFLDSLSRYSATLTKFITNYPVCSPSRAIMLTGQHPFDNKVYANVNSRTAPFGIELPKDITCWSDVLKSKGYYNGYIGKWHLDSPHKPYINTSNNSDELAWNEWTPPNRRHGFDYWYAYGTYDVHDKPMYWSANAKRGNFHYVNQWGPEHEADKAIAFFKNTNGERAANKPFSLVISMNPPHTGYYSVPKRYYDKYENIALETLLTDPDIPGPETSMGKAYRKNVKYYYANITGVDEQIGRIIEGLKKQDLLNNTIVIITADHGNCLGKHNEITKNNIYESSLEVPFIIYWKDKIHPGINKTLMASMIDFYPTILALTGTKLGHNKKIIGKSFAENLLKKTGKDMDKIQFFMGRLGDGNMKMSGFRGVRTKRHKLAYDISEKGIVPYFFNLKKDPFELNNIYNKNNRMVKRLNHALKNYLKSNNDPFAQLVIDMKH